MIANSTVVRGHIIHSFEEDVAGDGALRHEVAVHESGERIDHDDLPDGQNQDQQEPYEMKVPIAPTEEEKRYHNLTHYPYRS
eukprot:6158936-Amphidinium_carterae.1